jgi:hypothetical protein
VVDEQRCDQEDGQALGTGIARLADAGSPRRKRWNPYVTVVVDDMDLAQAVRLVCRGGEHRRFKSIGRCLGFVGIDSIRRSSMRLIPAACSKSPRRSSRRVFAEADPLRLTDGFGRVLPMPEAFADGRLSGGPQA